jgi:hypothetical protein
MWNFLVDGLSAFGAIVIVVGLAGYVILVNESLEGE